MSIEENKAIIRRYIEELNRRNVSVIDEVIAEILTVQILHHSPPSAPEWVGREAVRQGYLRNITAYPDYGVTIEEMLAEDDRVVLYWTHRGTHQGEFNPQGASGSGIAPTGKVITGAAITFYRIVDGKIAEMRALWDRADTWQQFGLIPDEDEILQTGKGQVVAP
jgi:steroid delta-isomerase-like uncharacterized protein